VRSSRVALLLLLIGSATVDARADAPANRPGEQPFYLGLGLGWSYANPLKLEPGDGVIDFDFSQWSGALSAGTRLGGHWRGELGLSYMRNAPEVLYVHGSDVELDTRGDDLLQQTILTVSLFRDFEFGAAFRPYVGAGVGVDHLDLRFIEFDPVTEEQNPLIDDKAWAFAYHLTAGLSVPVSRRLQLGLEYRYWRVPSVSFADLSGNRFDSGQATHSGWLRLNWKPGGWGWSPRALPDRPAAGRGLFLSASIGSLFTPDRDFLGIPGQFDAWDVGAMGSIALRYDMGHHWFVEAEAVRRRNEMQIYDTRIDETRTKGSVRGDSLALNVGYAFRPTRAINPYASLGMGAARIRYDLDVAVGRVPFIKDTGTATLFQWQFGVDIALSSRWTITAGYRGDVTTDFTIERVDGEPLKTSYLSHATFFGARCRLGPPT
jgi:opacity protein-like surface antigen